MDTMIKRLMRFTTNDKLISIKKPLISERLHLITLNNLATLIHFNFLNVLTALIHFIKMGKFDYLIHLTMLVNLYLVIHFLYLVVLHNMIHFHILGISIVVIVIRSRKTEPGRQNKPRPVFILRSIVPIRCPSLINSLIYNL